MKRTFNTRPVRPSGGSLEVSAQRRFDTGFFALDTLIGFSEDLVPDVPPREDLVREISSAHSADVHPERISSSVVQHTEKNSGSPDAETSSLNEGTRSGAETLTRTGYGGYHSAGGGTHGVFN